jgi:WD40 repeat protein
LFTHDIFVCCSTIKLWALTGQPLLEMIGHSSLVYSVDAHSSGLIASGSEDRSLKIWKGDVILYSKCIGISYVELDSLSNFTNLTKSGATHSTYYLG